MSYNYIYIHDFFSFFFFLFILLCTQIANYCVSVFVVQRPSQISSTDRYQSLLELFIRINYLETHTFDRTESKSSPLFLE